LANYGSNIYEALENCELTRKIIGMIETLEIMTETSFYCINKVQIRELE
jgi:hypothetical protein